MFEIIFILILIATLLVTGLTMVGMFAAVALSLMFILLMSLFSTIFKLLPWLLVIGCLLWGLRQSYRVPR